MIQDVGIELFELVETEPKTRSAKRAYHTGIPV